MNDNSLRVLASIGLGVGGVLGMAGTFAPSASQQVRPRFLFSELFAVTEEFAIARRAMRNVFPT